MPRILSTPDSGGFDRVQHNGHGRDVLVADLREYELSPVEPSPELVAEQTRILEDELAAFLADQDGTATAEEADSRPVEEVKPGLLPGFETLTWADLHQCPSWCALRDLEVHSDGFDTDPDDAPHRSVEHVVQTVNGGAGIDRAGRTELTVQLEQDRYLADDPTIVLSVVVNGIEQYAWLTRVEARSLCQALGHLLTETEPEFGSDLEV